MKKDLYFAVESGRTLELAKAHARERQEQHDRNSEIAKELGVDQFVVSFMDGAICGVVFDGPVHPDFKKPNRHGVSYPKKKTEWYDRFEQIKGHDARGYDIAEALGVPTVIQYEGDGVSGSSVIAAGFSSGVGFLYLSEDGPFALYCPDVAERVAYYESQGYTVDAACKGFKPKFDGARPILKEEWELTVAKWKLEQSRVL